MRSVASLGNNLYLRSRKINKKGTCVCVYTFENYMMSTFTESSKVTMRRDNLPINFYCPSTTGTTATSSTNTNSSTSSSSSLLLDRNNNNTDTFVLSESDATTVQTIEVGFDYAFAIVDPNEGDEEVIEQDLPLLEYTILYNVAKSIGLLTCDLTTQNVSSWSNETNSNHSTGQPEPYIISLSSDQMDHVDVFKGECESLIVPNGWICLPMQGSMTATYTGSASSSKTVENFLLHHIKLQMESGTLGKRGSLALHFFGDRNNVGIPSIGSVESTNDNKQSTTPQRTALAASLSVGFLVVILLVLAVIIRRRQRYDDEEKHLQCVTSEKVGSVGSFADQSIDGRGGGLVIDLEAGASSEDQSTLATTDACADAENEQMLLSQRIGTAPPIKANPDTDRFNAGTLQEQNLEQLDDIVADTSAAGSDISTPEEENDKTIRKQEESQQTRISISPTPVPVSDVLPPKPPGGSTSKLPTNTSKTIKPNRKKKKRKKQPLVRVNSRESMNEMATITEGKEEEETVGGGEDDGSEYSWCSTDEDDARNASRDPSPDRSHSRSRDPSPSSQSRSSAGSSTGSTSGGINKLNNNSGYSASSSTGSITTSGNNDSNNGQPMLETINIPPSRTAAAAVLIRTNSSNKNPDSITTTTTTGEC